MAKIGFDEDDKKLALKKDSLIYQKRTDAPEKQVWKSLSGKEKWQYYKDYYLFRTIIILVIIAAGTSFLISIFKHRPECVVYAAMENIYMDVDGYAEFKKNFLKDFNLDDNDYEISFDDTYHSANDTYSDQKMSAYLYSERIDMYVGERRDLREFALNGNCLFLDEILPEETFQALKDEIYYIHDEENDSDVPVGISLKNCKRYRKLDKYSEDPYIAIVWNTKHKDYVIAMIQYLFDQEVTVTIPVVEAEPQKN